jgi:hypothetical protein
MPYRAEIAPHHVIFGQALDRFLIVNYYNAVQLPNGRIATLSPTKPAVPWINGFRHF